jgi:death-on-curing protein
LYELAACYCVGIAKNHAFVDGNKRTGYQAAVVFLELNGWLATPSELEIVEMMVRVAEGEADEKDLAEWLRHNSSRI